jgi:hypothetical protein
MEKNKTWQKTGKTGINNKRIRKKETPRIEICAMRGV